MKKSFRVANYTDFNKLKCSRLTNSSYRHVAFPLGCSRSEFQLNLDDREISLLNSKGEVIGFVRIKSIMHTHIYLDYFCINDPEACVAPLADLQNYLIKSYDINKFFIQLLDHEKLEQQTLKSNQYEREASLSKHVWLNDTYKDIYIYGSPLYV